MSRGSVLSVVVVLLLFQGGLVKAQNTSFAFPDFNLENKVNITDYGDGIFDRLSSSYLMNSRGMSDGNVSCGRIMYKHPVQMVDDTGAVASFQTAFTASFESDNATACGDGMTFMFLRASRVEAPDFTSEEYGRSGSGFCLLNFSATPPDQHVFAVEIDSFQSAFYPWNQSQYEPSGAHIGVDVNNRSLDTAEICNITTMKSFCSGANRGFCGKKGRFAVWIDYDSGTQKLEVRISSAADNLKPPQPAISVTIDNTLNQVFSRDMYVGFGGSTGDLQETHTPHSWNFSTTGIVTAPAPASVPSPDAPASVPSPDAPSSNKSSALQVVAGICGAVGVILGLGVLYWFCKRPEMKASQELELMQYSNLRTELGLTETSWEYTYKELSRMTNNFSDSELLGSGGFGDVFKGTLASGALVAVKRIKRRKEQDLRSFAAEATSMRQIRHRNLLQLRGWCVSKEGMLLVFDFMPNSSLDKWIHASSADRPTLRWQVRRNILAGVASGLAYLHGQCVLHRDIKSDNVMLDEEFNAYLGDFGLARLVDHHKGVKTTLPAGTLGYMAPEMLSTLRATMEADVYAFGILMLELVCGRRPLALNYSQVDVADPKDYMLVYCVWRAHEAGDLLSVADGSLLVDSEENKVQETSELLTMMKWVLHLGLLCCHPNPGNRPSMRDVDQWFFSQACDGVAMELPRLPATNPYSEHYLFRSKEFLESGTISASSSSQTSSLIGSSSSLQTSSSHPSHLADNVSLSDTITLLIEDPGMKTSSSSDLLEEFGDPR